MARDGAWEQIRRALDDADGDTVRALVGDVYQRVPEARALIATALSPVSGDESGLRALDPYRRRIIAALRQPVSRGAMPDVARARRAIRDYRARTKDHAGIADLLITFLEEAVSAAGRLDEPPSSLFDSVHAACDDLRDVLRSVPAARRPSLWNDRIRGLERAAPPRPGLSSALAGIAAALST